MNLVVDLGNTRIKYALFSGSELKEVHIAEYAAIPVFKEIIKEKKIKHSIVSCVLNQLPDFVNTLKEQTNYLEFTTQTKIPVKNLYRTASTLGSDRLAGVIGAQKLFPFKNVLVIDAGTCIKYNFINSQNEYLGGAISPGINMRFKALHNYTGKLPLLKADLNFNTLIGTTSDESILSGVMNGVLFEVEGTVNEYKKQYPDLTVVVTGGDSVFFEKRLKTPIFADHYLILKGLNEIIQYNFSNHGR